MSTVRNGPEGFTVLRADRVLTCDGSDAIPHGALLLEGDRISAVGPSAEIQPPDGAEANVVDYGDATILPGLVDCHTHLCAPGDGTPGDEVAKEHDDILLLQAAKNARTVLHSGVTTIRENGAKNRVAFSLKEGVRRDLAPGPRMVVCGRPLAITGGHMGYFGSEADGEDGVRHAVRQLLKEGADYLKIVATGGSTRTSDPNIASFTVDELRAATDEAHRFGKLTAAHCTSTRGIENCLDAQVDMIIHCIFNEPDGTHAYRSDLVDRLVAADAWVNPTLYVAKAGADRMLANRPESALSPAERVELERAKRAIETRIHAVERMTRQGARMVAGSDSPWGWYAPGEFVHELVMLASAGLTNRDAILAGTRWSAESIGAGDVAGLLALRRPADVLVVRGDPVQDIRALWQVLDVFQSGHRVLRGVN